MLFDVELSSSCNFKGIRYFQKQEKKLRMKEAKKAVGRPKEFDRGEALERALQVFWDKGYVLSSMSELCTAMQINAPSLYATFGNKSQLYLDALKFYEEKYWAVPAQNFLQEKDITKAVRDFFTVSIEILYSQKNPCGCMTVLAAVSIPLEEKEIHAIVQEQRNNTQTMFLKRFKQAVADGQFTKETDCEALAVAMNTLLEGLSIQAKTGVAAMNLQEIPELAVRMMKLN